MMNFLKRWVFRSPSVDAVISVGLGFLAACCIIGGLYLLEMKFVIAMSALILGILSMLVLANAIDHFGIINRLMDRKKS
jgi:uncharacterized membrane protein YdfJ with MMPL/SSD domain